MSGTKTSGRKISSITGEKYISWDDNKKSYRLVIAKKTIGRFKILEEAIIARDKYLTEI